jgi:Cu(I)/Ag(I) efflux system periplasmic protein CusF
MKRILTALALASASLISQPTIAANDHAQHGTSKAAAAPMEMVFGQVKKVDQTTQAVTLAHGPLTNLGMPAMTMTFKVSDAAWLGQMKAGDKIRFMADRVNDAYTVVHFEPAK